MSENPLGRNKKSSAVAITAGVVLFLLGLAAWFAMVPVTFFGGWYGHTHDPVTRSLLMVFLVIYVLAAGSGTALIVSKLTRSHVVSRIVLVVFLLGLALGLAVFAWLGTLPNGLETPSDPGPSPSHS